MKNSIRLLSIASLVLSAPASAQNVLVNPSFETGNFHGWETFTYNGGLWVVGGGTSGAFQVRSQVMFPSLSFTVLEQEFAPVDTADVREVSFWYKTHDLFPPYLNLMLEYVSGASTSLSLATGSRQWTYYDATPSLLPGDQLERIQVVEGSRSFIDDAYYDDFVVLVGPSAASVFRNAGANPTSYTASAPVIGSNWDASVDLSLTGHAQAQIVGHLDTANVVLPGGQVLLVGGPRVFALPPVGAPASWSVPIPPDTSLLGRSVATQAVHLLGLTPYALSNAQDLTIGY